MATSEKILILIGFEGTELTHTDPITGKTRLVWLPLASDPRWRHMVKEEVTAFLARNVQDEWRWDATTADFAVFRNADQFVASLGNQKYTRVVVYSHGDENAAMGTRADWSTHVRQYTLAKAFAAAGIKQALLLGCESKKLAEVIAKITEGLVRVGGIEWLRNDDIDDRRRKLTILNPIIWGYGGGQ